MKKTFRALMVDRISGEEIALLDYCRVLGFLFGCGIRTIAFAKEAALLLRLQEARL